MSKKNNSKSNILINKPILIKIGLVVIAVIVAVFTFVLVYNLSYSGLIFPKTYVGGINLGSKTPAQAKILLAQNMAQVEAKEVEVVAGEQKFTIKPSDIDIKYDLEKSVDLAWATGRKGNLVKVLKEQIWSVFASNHNQVVFTFSEEKLQTKIKEIVAKTDTPERDATIEIVNLEPKVVAEKSGQRINQDKTRNLILASFGDLKLKSQVNIIIEIIQPKIIALVAAEKLEQTKKILENKITLTGKDKTFTLEPKDIAGLLEFTSVQDKITRQWELNIGVSHDLTKKYLENIAKDIDQEAKDAKFVVKSGHVSTFQVEQTGYELNQEDSILKISTAILNQSDQVKLLVKTVEPDIKSNNVDSKGIKELVAEGVTSWQGSSSNRIHNLTLGSENISGTIVKPGEEFSTVKAIGPIDAEHGFVKELVIKNSNQVAPEVGGGLCQVSTTLFRAALNAGLKITDRTNHSFRVSYYEPPVGMDATIYDPKPDFKFINNMSTPILIWATPTNNGLSFQIYGTKDGRKVEISTPVLFNYVSPGNTVYRETDTMETGAMRLVERATRGVTASFTYNVHDASGNVLEDDKFVSKYVPVPETYLVGPGTVIPPAQ